MTSLKTVFSDEAIEKNSVAVGSVKSQIGHTRMAAGVAGLIKTSMALFHKVKPTTINVTEPDPNLGLDESALYINKPQAWVKAPSTGKRRAAISSFGLVALTIMLF